MTEVALSIPGDPDLLIFGNQRSGFQAPASDPHTSSLLFTPVIDNHMIVPFGMVILEIEVFWSVRRIGRLSGTTDVFNAL